MMYELSLQVLVCVYYTNPLSLDDLYPYGTNNGDIMRTGLSSIPITSLSHPINNLAVFAQQGLRGTRYRVSRYTIYACTHKIYGCILMIFYSSCSKFSFDCNLSVSLENFSIIG